MLSNRFSDDTNTPLLPRGTSSSDTDRRLSSWHLSTLSPILAILSCVLFSFNSELLQFLQLHGANGGHASPMLNLILCHLGGLVFAPRYLFWSPAGIEGSHNVKFGSLLLALLLMGYNYTWLLSARFLAVGLTNAILQTSVAFVYLASVVVFKERCEAVQIVGVVFALGGSLLASGFEDLTPGTSSNVYMGMFLALFAAVGCMVYQVLFKYLYGHFKSDARFLAHIGAWVSVWHIVAILPLAFVAHLTGFEEMTLPHGMVAVRGTLLSALIASTVNAMYICLVMWGSTMLLPCASALSIPCTVLFDLILHHVVPTRLQAIGHSMVVLSVILILGIHKSLTNKKASPAEPTPPESTA